MHPGMKSAIVHGKAAGSDKGSGVDLVILILAIFVFATILFVGAQVKVQMPEKPPIVHTVKDMVSLAQN